MKNRLLKYIHAGMAEQVHADILERTMKGRIARAKEGKPWCGNRPTGRRFNKEWVDKKTRKRGRWEITEQGHKIAKALKVEVKTR